MAQYKQLLLICDVHDGDAEAAKTVSFMVEGRSYECELCEAVPKPVAGAAAYVDDPSGVIDVRVQGLRR